MHLRDIAPRLARARDQLLAERIDHRDLQLQRAYAGGSGRYIAHRQRKLDAARRELARFRKRQGNRAGPG